jgi:hypothetical protein
MKHRLHHVATAGTLALLTAACGADSASSTQDDDLILRPNGTADIATITLKLPAGFAETASLPTGDRIRFRFAHGERPLTPGIPSRVNAVKEPIRVTVHVGMWPERLLTSAALEVVEGRPGFDVTAAISAVRVNGLYTPLSTNVALYPEAAAYGFDITPPDALLRLDRAGVVPMLTLGDETIPVYARAAASAALWDRGWMFGDVVMPVRAGPAHVRLKTDARTFTLPDVDFTVAPGVVTTVDVPVVAPASFVYRLNQPDERTMPAAVADPVTVVCQGAGGPPREVPTNTDLRFFAGKGTFQCSTIVAATGQARPFTATAGGALTEELRILEVDDVTLVDDPPNVVRGVFSVFPRLPTGAYGDAIPMGGSTSAETHRGITLFHGSYKVRVTYTNLSGVSRSTDYPVDL